MGRECVKTRFVWFEHVTVSAAVNAVVMHHRSDHARVGLGGMTTLHVAVPDYMRSKQYLMEPID